MALARGLMLKGSSGRLTESDSPQMYTCIPRRTLGHMHKTATGRILLSCYIGSAFQSRLTSQDQTPSPTGKAHLQCHLDEGKLLDLCVGLQVCKSIQC